MKPELYFSIDMEASGPIPGEYSMLSVAAVAIFEGKIVGDFSVNLKELPNSKKDPATTEFWSKFPTAYAATTSLQVDPEIGMKQFAAWIDSIRKAYGNRQPVMVAYPAGFDFTFVYWYFIKFTGSCPFSFTCLDMKTMAMVLLNTNFRDSVKKNMPKKWHSIRFQHTHIALDDAREQADLFINMMNAMNKLHIKLKEKENEDTEESIKRI